MPIMTLDPEYVTTGKPRSKCCQCEPRQLDGADPTMCEYCEMIERHKQMDEAYITACEFVSERRDSNLAYKDKEEYWEWYSSALKSRIKDLLNLINEKVDQNKRLEEELDTWKKAYVTAENESRRFQEAYEEIYQNLYNL